MQFTHVCRNTGTEIERLASANPSVYMGGSWRYTHGALKTGLWSMTGRESTNQVPGKPDRDCLRPIENQGSSTKLFLQEMKGILAKGSYTDRRHVAQEVERVGW